ncbi:hypothetical protein RDABS01_024950 [Bienertia sinuspersici]
MQKFAVVTSVIEGSGNQLQSTCKEPVTEGSGNQLQSTSVTKDSTLIENATLERIHKNERTQIRFNS